MREGGTDLLHSVVRLDDLWLYGWMALHSRETDC